MEREGKTLKPIDKGARRVMSDAKCAIRKMTPAQLAEAAAFITEQQKEVAS